MARTLPRTSSSAQASHHLNHADKMTRIKQLFFSFDGRIGRRTFWLAYGALLSISGIIAGGAFVSEEIAGIRTPFEVIFSLWLPFFLTSSLALQLKRWHDRGKPEVMILLPLTPVIGYLWAIIELGFLPGTRGFNRYDSRSPPPEGTATEEAGYNLLDRATQLEIDGRVSAALAAYEAITRQYGHSDVGHDAQKSAESLRAKMRSN